MPRHDPTLIAADRSRFAPTSAGEPRDWLTDRARYVLWQATGVVIDDTDFGPPADLLTHRWWFPPCTHQMSPQWWAKMRAAAQRVEEAFRSGSTLHTQNFAEDVVLASVLRSGAMQEMIDSVVYDEHEQYATLVDCGEDDLDFDSVIAEMAGDGDGADRLFLDEYRGVPAVVEADRRDLERWFDPYDLGWRCAKSASDPHDESLSFLP